MPLRDEILEQPDVLRRLLREGRTSLEQAAVMLRRDEIHWIYLAARGSSDHAALYAKYTLGIRNRIPTALAAPSIFTLYDQEPDLRHALVVGISQSGESPDIVRVLAAAAAQGQPTLAITNTPSSPLARQADLVIDLLAGEERSVAATKTYTAQLMAIAMLSAALTGDQARWDELERMPETLDQVLSGEDQAKGAAGRFASMDRCTVLGRGFNYATSFEWALKLKELTGIHAEPYSSADFLHGPVAATDRQTPVLGVAPAGRPLEDMLRLLSRIAAERQCPMLVISNREEARSLSEVPLSIPDDVPEWLSPLATIVAAQLFCYWLTVGKGLDPERPPGLSKITRTT